MRLEGAAAVEAVRVRAQVGAQGGDDRAVGRGRAVGRPAPEDGRVRVLGQLLDEPRLADAGLARDQHERAVAEARPVESLVELLELSVAPNERTLNGHGEV